MYKSSNRVLTAPIVKIGVINFGAMILKSFQNDVPILTVILTFELKYDPPK